MAKRVTDQEAIEFGQRLVALLAARDIPRRGAGAYLAGKYKVSTVTANDWLNGRFKPATSTARAIADDHGSTFDELYFGRSSAHTSSTALSTTAAHDVRPDFDRMAAAVFLLREFLANAMFAPELLFDARMLEMAWEGVEYAGTESEPSNVLDFMKFMRKRMEERGVSVRQVEAQTARRGNG